MDVSESQKLGIWELCWDRGACELACGDGARLPLLDRTVGLLTALGVWWSDYAPSSAGGKPSDP